MGSVASLDSDYPVFKSAIVKLTAYCNLSCTYCYMFNLNDKTYTRVPQMMSTEVADQLMARVEEHAAANKLEKFTLSLHGGEPTLWPLASFAHLLDSVERVRNSGLDIFVLLQTNGYFLKPDLLRLLSEHEVSVAVSLDGPKRFNDTRRITRGGGGSYDEVIENIRMLKGSKYRGMLKGVLCVANPDIPPNEFFNWIDSLPIRRVDILWPMEFNHHNLPWGPRGFEEYCRRPRYGEWFSELFKLWWKKDDPTLQIRLFLESLLVLLGSSRHTDMLVNDTVDMMVVNTDGAIEYHDFLRAHADGATRTSFNLGDNSFNDLRTDEVFRFLHHLGRNLPEECQSCEVVKLCGGGYLPGRMDVDSRLPLKRSVLCLDQFRFFETVYETLGKSSGSVGAKGLPPFVERLNVHRSPILQV